MKKWIVGLVLLGLVFVMYEMVIGASYPGPFRGGQGSGLRIDLKAQPVDQGVRPTISFRGSEDQGLKPAISFMYADWGIRQPVDQGYRNKISFVYNVVGVRSGGIDGTLYPQPKMSDISDPFKIVSFKDIFGSIPMLMINGGGIRPIMGFGGDSDGG